MFNKTIKCLFVISFFTIILFLNKSNVYAQDTMVDNTTNSAIIISNLNEIQDEKDLFIQKEEQLKKQKENRIIIGYEDGTIEVKNLGEKQNSEDIQRTIQTLKEENKNIKYIEEDSIKKICSSPNDTYYDEQWYLNTIGYEKSLEMMDSDKSILVAVIDTGIELNCWELKNKISPYYWNFLFDDDDVYDINGHGTAVSGIIAAETNNNYGIAGVTGELNIKILPLQAFFIRGEGYLSDIVKAIDYAIEKDVDIINMSYGSDKYSAIENSAIRRAIDAGIIIVASAGNDGDGEHDYPASYKNVISVGATDKNDKYTSFSNYNYGVDIVAPGKDIKICGRRNGFDIGSGTSYSAPIVSGVIATLKSLDSSLSRKDIEDIIYDTAIDKGLPGKDTHYGYGIVNMYEAITSIIDIDDGFEELPSEIVGSSKVWKIEFSMPVDVDTITGGNIYITDKNRDVLPMIYLLDRSVSKTTISIYPIEDYSTGEYMIWVKDLKNTNGTILSKNVKKRFFVWGCMP